MEFNSCLADTLKTCGPFLISGEGAIENIVQVLVQVITKKHTCQQGFDDDDEPFEDEENSEDDWYVIETALDTVSGLAKALGSQFGELWKIFEKPIISYASATSPTERSATVGTLADTLKGMKDGCTPYTTGLLKILLHRLSDEDSQVKSNAAYAVGMLVENSGNVQEIKKAYPTILGKLEPLLHTSEARQLDNAAGCVARMISRHPDNIPLDDVLPALVNLLPLKEDYEENIAVWPMIVRLYRAGNPTVQNLTPQIAQALEQVIGEPEDQLNDETREEVHQLIVYLHSKQPGAIQQFPQLAKIVQ
jgi:importin-4